MPTVGTPALCSALDSASGLTGFTEMPNSRHWPACLDFPLLNQVVKEALRLFTPVPYQLRVTTAATELCGIALPPKSRVLIGTWTTNRASTV